MLVLTRRCNQSIVIDGRIVVRVLQVSRDQVRLGIEAPSDIEVHREEVYLALKEANEAASMGTELSALGQVLKEDSPGATQGA